MYTVFIISPSTASSLVKVELSLAKRLNFVLMKQQNVFIARGFLNCSTRFFFYRMRLEDTVRFIFFLQIKSYIRYRLGPLLFKGLR